MASTIITIQMVNRLPKKFNFSLNFLFLLVSSVAIGQSCVCNQKDLLNDFKDTDFIGIVTVTSKKQHELNPDVDVINFATQEIFKGDALEEVFIFQKKGHGKNNNSCRLFLEEGDQLLLYANKKAAYHFTMSCYRNKMLNNTEKEYQESVQNHIKILRQLKPHADALKTSTTKCSNAITDADALAIIENIKVIPEEARMGLYSVKFTEDNKIDRIEVVSPFNEEVDNKVRIALIKKKWNVCDLNKDRKLILGYFYTPSTFYRRAHLSPL